MEADFPNRALVNNNHDLWFYLIQLSDMKVRECGSLTVLHLNYEFLSHSTSSILFKDFYSVAVSHNYSGSRGVSHIFYVDV